MIQLILVDNCNEDCEYDIKLCIGEPLDGVCTFAEHRFTIPHNVPEMFGSYISSTNTVVQNFPVDFKTPVEVSQSSLLLFPRFFFEKPSSLKAYFFKEKRASKFLSAFL